MNRDLRTIVVDDEPLARSFLRELLAEIEGVEVIAECVNGFEALKAVNEYRPDLLFLDIQMPKLDGFEVLELLGKEAPQVIFATAYDQFALKAFEANAVDYLLKPVSLERLSAAVAKAQRWKLSQEAPTQPDPVKLAAGARGSEPLRRIVVKDGEKVIFIPADKLDYAQAQDDYVLLRSEGREILKQQTLQSLESLLDPREFVRIHRSFLIRLDRMKKLELEAKDQRVAILRDGTRLPVSRSGYQRLREFWAES